MTASRLRPAGRSRRWGRRAGLLSLVALLAVANGCGGDDDEPADRTTTTVARTTEPADDTTTTTTAGSDGSAASTTTSTDPGGEPDPGGQPGDGDDVNGEEWGRLDAPVREGTVENAADGEPLRLDLRRDGQRAELRTGELTLTCLPLLEGDPTTRTTEVLFTDLAVAADGSVEAVLADAPFKPALTGFFAEDGSFTGSIFFSDVVDDFACGGEFPLLVPAG